MEAFHLFHNFFHFRAVFRINGQIILGWVTLRASPKSGKYGSVTEIYFCYMQFQSPKSIIFSSDNGYIIISTSTGIFSCVERYNRLANEWELVPGVMTVDRSCFGCCFLDGEIYAVGGYGPLCLNRWVRAPASLEHIGYSRCVSRAVYVLFVVFKFKCGVRNDFLQMLP